MNLRKEKLKSVTLFFLALISHLPFLMAGYGREEDAWAQALNARDIWTTGIYEVSRLPGHPLYELLLAGLWPLNHSYYFFNLLSALATSFAVVFFYQIALKLKLKQAFTLAFAFSFVPVVFMAGNYTIDYNFALCLILASFYLLLSKKFIWAGLLLGLATGFRISSLAFLLPYSIMAGPQNQKGLLKYWIASGCVALLSFLPPILTYGLSFLDFHKPPFPSWANIIYELSFGIWGVPLSIGLALLLFLAVFRKALHFSLNKKLMHDRNLLWVVGIIWILQLLVFTRLPFKAEFFIPAIPFLMLLIGVYFRKIIIKLMAGMAFLSSFLLGFDYANPYRGSTPTPLALHFDAGGKKVFMDPIQGPAILDYGKRVNKSEFAEKIIGWKEGRKKPAWLIAGWYWPELMLKSPDTSLVKLDYYSTEKELKMAHKKGQEIYFLPEINEANAKINAHYLADSLGQPLNLQ